jgi:hypothetical protein
VVLFCFLFQTPHDGEQVATFAWRNESALFHGASANNQLRINTKV